ncbi:MAG: RNA 2',3'-cyclic phosphodiesterase [Bacteroidales bacterium]
MKRLFLAIKITPNDIFSKLYRDLRQELIYEKINWVAIDNFHLTLKFFGETDDSIIEKINLFIEDVISGKNQFSFEISDLGIFGSNYQPKVIWLGIKNNTALINLADTILNQLKSIGFERDRQNFVPHLTLGRINYLKDKDNFNKIIKKFNIADIQTVEVKEIILFESILQREGPIYKVINSYKLTD